MRPSLLFLDLETSGLPPKGEKLTFSNPNWPWPLHIAAELTDETGAPSAVPQFFSLAVQAEGRAIQAGAERIHGISSREAGRMGIPEMSALDLLVKFSLQARRLVTFGGTFDSDIIAAALTRLALARPEERRSPVVRLLNAWQRSFFELCDVRELCTAVCRIEREDGSFKWPKLDEALLSVVGDAAPDGPHDAWTDLGKLKRVYLALHARGLIEPIIEIGRTA